MLTNTGFSEGLGGSLSANISELVNDLSEFDNISDYVVGDTFQATDASLAGDLASIYQTRLFSPEVFRDRVLSAKLFDRIYALTVDPDEFLIVAPGQAQVGEVETPQEVFDFYLQRGIIEQVGFDDAIGNKYKLAPRKYAEGSMALGRVTVAMTTVDDEAETILEL